MSGLFGKIFRSRNGDTDKKGDEENNEKKETKDPERKEKKKKMSKEEKMRDIDERLR